MLSTEIKNILNTFANKNSAFLIPADIDMTPTGWIILKYLPLDIDDPAALQTESTNINKVHESFEELVDKIKSQYSLTTDKWGGQYMPHISIGRIVSANGGDPSSTEISAAQDYLKHKKNDILKALLPLRTLNLFDLKLMHNDSHGQPHELVSKQLDRRNFNIKKVKDKIHSVDIEFSSPNDAQRFAKFVFILTGTTYSIANKHNTPVIQMSPESFSYIAGIVQDCVAPKFTPANQHAATSASSSASVNSTHNHSSHSGPSSSSNSSMMSSSSAAANPPKNSLNSSANIFFDNSTSSSSSSWQQNPKPTAPRTSKEILASYGTTNLVKDVKSGKWKLCFANHKSASDFSEKIFHDFGVKSAKPKISGNSEPKQVALDSKLNIHTLMFDPNEYTDMVAKLVQSDQLQSKSSHHSMKSKGTG